MAADTQDGFDRSLAAAVAAAPALCAGQPPPPPAPIADCRGPLQCWLAGLPLRAEGGTVPLGALELAWGPLVCSGLGVGAVWSQAVPSAAAPRLSLTVSDLALPCQMAYALRVRGGAALTEGWLDLSLNESSVQMQVSVARALAVFVAVVAPSRGLILLFLRAVYIEKYK